MFSIIILKVKKRAARKARNPRTGERVDVEAKFVVTFKPGKEMEEKVRQLQEYSRGQKMSGQSPGADTASGSPPVTGTFDTPGGYGSNPTGTN